MKNKITVQYSMDSLIKRHTYIAICPVKSVQEAVRVACILSKRGIKFMEVAYRGEASFKVIDKAIRAIRRQVPSIIIGAGTVRNKKIAKRALKAGAQFVMSPGANKKTIKYCIKHFLPIYPGVYTASEVEFCQNYELKVLKFFPSSSAESVKILKAFAAPFYDIKFIVSGGINKEREREFTALENVAGISGSYLYEEGMN